MLRGKVAVSSISSIDCVTYAWYICRARLVCKCAAVNHFLKEWSLKLKLFLVVVCWFLIFQLIFNLKRLSSTSLCTEPAEERRNLFFSQILRWLKHLCTWWSSSLSQHISNIFWTLLSVGFHTLLEKANQIPFLFGGKLDHLSSCFQWLSCR